MDNVIHPLNMVLHLQFLKSCVGRQVRKIIQFVHGQISVKEQLVSPFM